MNIRRTDIVILVCRDGTRYKYNICTLFLDQLGFMFFVLVLVVYFVFCVYFGSFLVFTPCIIITRCNFVAEQ